MKKIATLLFSIVVLQTAYAQDSKTPEVNWMTMEEAYAASQKNADKKILIDLYTDWCGWCKRMDKDTYSHAEIAQYINQNYYPVKFDAEQKDSVLIMNHTFKFVAQGRNGYHELAAALMNGKMSYPTTVILDENFNVIQPIPGYQNAKNFEPILHFFATDAFKEENWETFQKNFTSKL